MDKYDVFISYSSKDKEIAFYVCDELEKRDLKCWIAPRNEVAGISYARQILQAISESSVFVVCFSKYSNESEHVESEIDNAFSAGKVIIPFRIDDCIMSPEMKYYLNKKHWLTGIPVDQAAIDELSQSIISNIPEKARTREIEHSIDNAILMVEDIIDKSNDSEQALKYSNDSSFKSRLGKLKSLNKLVDQMEASILVGKWTQEYILRNIEYLSGKIEGGGYEIFTNDEEELMLFTKMMSGEPDKPRFTFDGSSCAVLKKNKECAIMIENLVDSAIPLLKKNSDILIVELNSEGIVAEYKAKIKVQYELDELPEYHGMDDLDCEFATTSDGKRFDLMQDKNGDILLIISAMKGRPQNSASVFYGDKLLLYKNERSATLLENITERAYEPLMNSDYITVVEIIDDIAVSKFKTRLLKPEATDWDWADSKDIYDIYVPAPLDISEVRLSEETAMLADTLSTFLHEEEACGYYNRGWVYGTVHDLEKKETPLLQKYYKLDNETQQEYKRQVLRIFKMLAALGYEINSVKAE